MELSEHVEQDEPQIRAREDKPKKQDGTAYHWCFTWNNPPSDLQRNPERWMQLVTEGEECWHINYLVYQLEKGKKTGTHHFQVRVFTFGYVTLCL